MVGLIKELNRMLGIVDSILFTNRWTDRESQPEARTILENIH